ncbi:MAG: S-adenosylmethionine:tRNA ribosyltransferase-isomerase, partial [Acidimicrobiia bacterium]
METASFDYDLPPAAIAQSPAEPRDAARMLVDRGAGAPPEHRRVSDLPSLLGPGDVVVLNTTRVLRARLHLRKATGGAVEVLLLEPLDDGRWEALVRPG